MVFMFCYCKKLKEIDLSGICNNGYKLREMNELIDGKLNGVMINCGVIKYLKVKDKNKPEQTRTNQD